MVRKRPYKKRALKALKRRQNNVGPKALHPSFDDDQLM